ncbi:Ionotropic receptor 584 [Blattella germanica]|nr:Ionotropic receptor 584 [Blattella germanica]
MLQETLLWLLSAANTSSGVQKQLINCLMTISSTYFLQNQTLVISLLKSPENSMTEQKVLSHLHKVQLWSHIAFIPGIPSSNAFNISDMKEISQKNYIIFMNEQENDSLVRSLSIILQQMNVTASWNSQSYFVISLYKTISKDSIKVLLQFLWKWRVINVIILTRGFYEEMECIDVCSWFPYSNTDQCSSVKYVEVLDKWILENGSFMNNKYLFPNKLTKNLNKCTLRIMPRLTPYLLVETPIEVSEKLLYVSGWEVLLGKLIARYLNMTEEYLSLSHNTLSQYGREIGELDALMKDEVDLVYGGEDIKETNVGNIVSTRAYHWDIWSWYVPCATKYHTWESIFKIFSLGLWFAICLSVIALTVAMFLISKHIPAEKPIYSKPVFCLFYVIAIMTGVSISGMPVTIHLRIFVFLTVCYFYAVSTVFQAWLTSFLTDPAQSGQIKSIQELLDSNIRYGYVSYLEEYFEKDTEPQSKQILLGKTICPDLIQCVNWVGKYRNYSLVYTNTLENFLRSKSVLQEETDRSLLCKIENGDVLPITYAMVVLKGNPLLCFIDNVITRIVESGIFLKWKEDSFVLEKILAKSFGIHTMASEYCDLSLSHMQPVFFILLFGDGLAFITFILENIFPKFR